MRRSPDADYRLGQVRPAQAWLAAGDDLDEAVLVTTESARHVAGAVAPVGLRGDPGRPGRGLDRGAVGGGAGGVSSDAHALLAVLMRRTMGRGMELGERLLAVDGGGASTEAWL